MKNLQKKFRTRQLYDQQKRLNYSSVILDWSVKLKMFQHERENLPPEPILWNRKVQKDYNNANTILYECKIRNIVEPREEIIQALEEYFTELEKHLMYLKLKYK